jgi:hypothetical protein
MLDRPKLMLRSSWVLAFAFAMLLAQSLGLLHRAAGPAAPAHSHSSAHHHVDGHGEHGGNFLGKLFAGHSTDADCQVFDQLSHFDSASAMLAVGLSLALSSVLCALLQGLARARWHAQFQARGPPFPR